MEKVQTFNKVLSLRRGGEKAVDKAMSAIKELTV